MVVLAAAVIGFFALVLNPPQLSKVVLLPDAEGKAGAVIVKTQSGEQVVNTAYGSASVNQRGNISSLAEDAAKMMQQYGGTLTARPAAPISFIVSFEFGSAVDITAQVRGHVGQFVAGAEPSDDLAILVLHWIGRPPA